MPSPLENRLLLYYMSGIGGAIGGPESVGAAIGGMTQQQIQSESFMKLMKTLLAGGGKFGMDKDGMSLKAPVDAFADTNLSIPGFEKSYGGVSGALGTLERPRRPELPAAYNPSASPLDISGADLAGLTPENISQALQLKFMTEEMGRKTAADLTRAGYYGAAARRMEAETAAAIPSIDIPGVGKVTTKQFIDIWKTASKDERSAALKLYDRYVEQEEGAGRTPKSLENWTMQVAEASGKSLAEIMAEFMAKKEVGIDIEQRDRFRRPKFRTDIEKTIRDKRRYEYETADDPDKAFKRLTWKEMDKQVKSRFPGAVFGRDTATGAVGWFDKEGKLISSWQ